MAHEHTIAEFGRRMGLPRLEMARGRPVRLRVEGMGTLFVEEGERGEALVYLARRFPSHDREAPRRALALCRPGISRPFPVYAGLYKTDTLLFLVRFSAKNFSLQNLEQAVPFLSRLLDEALQG
ncbi:MAG: type III secretion chaperone SycN [Desulfovibrio sp.]|jgi:type III secretion system chaperone SycN|nr:type III secretion chaperone SycN [Desulfovibrio sp.]